ncbi:MAG: LamG domain-containing protein, partial [Planctomycetia bacterium]|nr:LamG domain-containing protein [Planctomycetia bacterium]
KILQCPEDVSPTAAASYGMNSRATRMMDQDSGRIVLLDYKTTSAAIVAQGQTVAQLNSTWPWLYAGRHFQRENVTVAAGAVQSYDPNAIDPRFCVYYTQFWQPVRDASWTLANCLALGQPTTTSPYTGPPLVPPTTTGGSGPSGGSTTGSTTGAIVGLTTGGSSPGSTTGSLTTGSTTSSTTTGGTTGGGTSTGGTTGSSPPPGCTRSPGVPNIGIAPVRQFLFDTADPALSEVGAQDTDKGNDCTTGLDTEPDPTKNRCMVGNFTCGPVNPHVTTFLLNASIIPTKYTLTYWWKTDPCGNTLIFSGSGWGNVYHGLYPGAMPSNPAVTTDPYCFRRGNGGSSPPGGDYWPYDAATSSWLPPTANQWNHYAVAVNRSNGTGMAWLNGKRCVSKDNSAAGGGNVGNLAIGSYWWPFSGTGYYYGLSGHYDDFRIYDVLLNDSQIQQIYDGSK